MEKKHLRYGLYLGATFLYSGDQHPTQFSELDSKDKESEPSCPVFCVMKRKRGQSGSFSVFPAANQSISLSAKLLL
jgi:hypothetical protein